MYPILLITFWFKFFSFAGSISSTKEVYVAAIADAANSGDFWVAQHSAEYLVELGYREQGLKICESVLRSHENTPQHRIGLWRVQYRLEKTGAGKAFFMDKLVTAYETSDGPDRIHAAETLAKLGYCFQKLNQSLVESDERRADMLGTFVTWGLTVPCKPQVATNIGELMNRLNASPIERQLAAYALTFLDAPIDEGWKQLAQVGLQESDPEVQAYLIGAAYQTCPPDQQASPLFEQIKNKLFLMAHSSIKAGRMEFCRAMAKRYDPAAAKLLLELVNLAYPITEFPQGQAIYGTAAAHPCNQDVRATAAYAILKNK